MRSPFEWLQVTTEYRDVRASRHGPELRFLLNRETIRHRPSGQVVTRSTIRHPGICVIVPLLGPEHILLMRQYRYSLDGELWELPAGTLDGREEGGRVIATETPAEGARRELQEETGYRAEEIEQIAACYAMPGSSDELIHVFLARGLSAGEPLREEGEIIHEIRPFAATELERMMARGEIRDAKTLVGLFYALGRRAEGLHLR